MKKKNKGGYTFKRRSGFLHNACNRKQEGYETYALSFRYGQRHDREILAAQNVAKYFNVKKHIILDIDLRSFGGSALTDNIPVPKERGLAEIPVIFPSHTCLHEIRFFSPLPSPGQKCLRHMIFSSGSMPLITAAIPIAVRSISMPSKRWQILPRKRGWKERHLRSTHRS